jgi:hypothetical protein
MYFVETVGILVAGILPAAMANALTHIPLRQGIINQIFVGIDQCPGSTRSDPIGTGR